jgi:hypothetical protein
MNEMILTKKKMEPTGTTDNIVATHVHDIVENMHATYYNDCRFFQAYIYDTYSTDQHALPCPYLVPKEMPSLFLSTLFFCNATLAAWLIGCLFMFAHTTSCFLELCRLNFR